MSAYAEGILDGFRIVLTLLDGGRAEGGVPYSGPKPPELERWIEQALSRLDDAGAVNAAHDERHNHRLLASDYAERTGRP